jgi:hypothetical protein
LCAVILLTYAPNYSLAAAKIDGSKAAGTWVNASSDLDFEIRPGARPDQLVLLVPSAVTFPGDHEFVLAKQRDGSFVADEPGRPKVTLSFASSSKAKV